MSSPSNAPKLAPPGAGLPLLERLIMRLWYGPIVSKQMSLDQIRTQYRARCEKIIAFVNEIPAPLRDERKLIKRLRGIEDSSRFWSINETLEHLSIVGNEIADAVVMLAEGKTPIREANIAAVKPKQAGLHAFENFVKAAPSLLSTVDARVAAASGSLDSKTTAIHPWFGAFTAKQWYWILMVHQELHWAQLRAIRAQL